MDTFEAIRTRRAVKHYDPDHRLSEEEITRLFDLAIQSPTCPMIGFEPEKVAELIGLPEDHVIGMLVAVGRATQPAWPKPGQLALSEVLIHDRFA